MVATRNVFDNGLWQRTKRRCASALGLHTRRANEPDAVLVEFKRALNVCVQRIRTDNAPAETIVAKSYRSRRRTL